MTIDPDQEQVLSDLANQLQVIVLVSDRLQATLGRADAQELHQAARTAARTLQRLQPDPADPRRV